MFKIIEKDIILTDIFKNYTIENSLSMIIIINLFMISNVILLQSF